MDIPGILKGVVGGGSGMLSGAEQGAISGAMSGNVVTGAISGALGGGGHPVLQMLLPMLLSGGLTSILHRFHHHGLSSKTDSWVSTGKNEALTPQEVTDSLGDTTVADLAAKTGLSTDEVAAQLSHVLPSVVDHVTPGGKLPSEDELVKLLQSVDPQKVS